MKSHSVLLPICGSQLLKIGPSCIFTNLRMQITDPRKHIYESAMLLTKSLDALLVTFVTFWVIAMYSQHSFSTIAWCVCVLLRAP